MTRTTPVSMLPGMKNLKRIRNEAGISQESLAEKSGLDRKTVIRCEGGEYAPSIETAKAIADALGVTVDALLQDAPKVMA